MSNFNMSAEEKHKFIAELVESVSTTVHANVDKMPEEWNGIELRQYLADKFADAADYKMPRTRKLNYNNEVIVRNL